VTSDLATGDVYMLRNALWLFALALLVLVIFLPAFSKMQDLQRKDREYQRQIAEMEAEYTRLLEEKKLLEEDPVYLEKVAREKMGLIREGEVIYKIMPAQNSPKRQIQPGQQRPEQKPSQQQTEVND
jgi:cell division protein FtsB